MTKEPKKDHLLSIRVFSDIQPEICHVVDGQIPYNESWCGFTATMNQHLFVRYLVQKHNPTIAETLLVDDDTLWPPEGVLPLRDDNDNIVNPGQYLKRADLIYDNGPGRGWWSLVHPKQDPKGLLNKLTEWRAINNAEDWDSLMKWLNHHREATAAFRHQSTKERMEFVAQKRQEEETTQLYGPLREESKLWEEYEMEVPKGSERLQSAAAKEIDGWLTQWGIKQGETDDKEENDGVAQEDEEGLSAKHCETLADAEEHGWQPKDRK